ncbi:MULTISPECIES: biotin--[acetyl-CoA-carboxylase] ligase [unclassified Brevibacterium]|uniref:biotin--[acetyl-CoA-carboxylase] ligase n=1 Tax=unclassified Brevibacterium TaxID=2614124 RepID=UPI000C57C7E5|nr:MULTISPECIES: biotin--[acetyl-CoA-carboxylase] ligase [unclassified Brevibacterium]SMX68231.1 BirA family transcriptional regulator, biotin operon repressor / biotin-[acetyl-CoA-carboxylase] ligase [Brevibacterium sp. 239c]
MNSQHIPLLVDVDSLRSKAADRGFELPTVIWDDVCSSTNDELAGLVRGQSTLTDFPTDRTRQIATADGVDLAKVPGQFSVYGTDHQNAGHGRLGRTWTVPPRRSLTFSILLEPGAVFDSWGWIPLLAGETVRAAIAEAGVPAVLKWPNDVLTTDGKKLCGILARVEPLPTGPRIVLGMGINTRLLREDLPRESASSIAIETDTDGSEVAHEDLLISILSTLIPAYRELVEYDDDDFSRSSVGCEVRANMVTLGTQVRVERPDGSNLFGRATGLDASGDLIIDNDICVSAGDVHHLRPAEDGAGSGSAGMEAGGRR